MTKELENHVALTVQEREGLSSTTAHTPGPWRLTFQPIGSDPDIPDMPYMCLTAGDGFWDDETNQGFKITGILSEADAHLLAAALEMLKALRKIANPVELARDASNFGAFSEAYLKYAQDIARAALAKASGRS